LASPPHSAFIAVPDHENEPMNLSNMDTLAKALANAAMTVLVRSCRKEVAGASHARLDAACAAMRAKARPVLDQLLDDAHAAPWVAEAAFAAAVLELAQTGIAALKASEA
jgi:hypothetical protein